MREIVTKVINHVKISPSDNLNAWNTLVGQLTPDEKDYVLALLKFKVKILKAIWKRPGKRI